jgi:hypothetical protein
MLEYLSSKYHDSAYGKTPVYLTLADADMLLDSCNHWRRIIFGLFKDRESILIREDNIVQLFPSTILSTLDDNNTRSDLIDGIGTILDLKPTPAAMLLLRVAESVVRKYHAKITGKIIDKSSWNDLLKELEASSIVKKPLLGYLHYLREKRNEASHPDKRFAQEEAEMILLQIKTLLVELSK